MINQCDKRFMVYSKTIVCACERFSRIPRVTFDCGVERIDLQVYTANFMHHA